MRCWLARGPWFLGLWVVIAGADPADLAAGVLAAALATWASQRLLPAGDAHISFLGSARIALRFLRQAPIAGLDVAWRALDPRLPLRPGVVTFASRFPPGAMRHVFCTLTSLAPGMLPAGADKNDALLIHCLDVDQPVTAQLSQDEALLQQAVGRMRGDG
jgi:multicomponent Na+:H+ antiporter subunit E